MLPARHLPFLRNKIKVSWENMFLTSAIPKLFRVVDAGQINFIRVYELS